MLKEVLLETLDSGVKYVSAYVFSTENWKRSEKEVGKLMNLLLKVLSSDVHIFIENNVRLKVVGARNGLSPKLLAAIDDAEARTADMTGGEMLLCLNYGGHLEITEAVKKIINSSISSNDVTEDLIAQNLYAPEVPQCDLIVRTGSEKRLSNFMLWRSAYSELIFLDKNWPDMTKQDVSDILKEYNQRQRRFGG